MATTKQVFDLTRKLPTERLMQLYMDLPFEQRSNLVDIRRLTSTLHRIAENECNGWPKPVSEYRDGKLYQYNVENEEWRAKDERKEERYRKVIETLCKANGWTVEFQGDPRGAVVKLQINGHDATDIVCK